MFIVQHFLTQFEKLQRCLNFSHAQKADSNTPLCQCFLGVKICCTGTWGVLSLLSQTDEWVYRLTDQCKAVFQEVTAAIVRGAGLGRPAPSWLTCVIQGVPTQRSWILAPSSPSETSASAWLLALTRAFPPETRTLPKYLVLPRSSSPHVRNRSCTGTVWEDAVQGSFSSSWNLPGHYLVEVHCSKIWYWHFVNLSISRALVLKKCSFPLH